MRNIKSLICTLFFFGSIHSHAQNNIDYYQSTNFEKYAEANKLSSDPNRVVFMGNSITEGWPIISPEFFEDHSNYIGRGIGGQTTPQMLLRFRKDVIQLRPKVVVILAGINDIAQNTGFTPIDVIADNIMSMADLAQENKIEVILCSVLPAIDFPWRPGLEPVNKVVELNNRLKVYAQKKGLQYVDYHSAMKDEQNGLKVPEYTKADDLVHPNADGYKVMESLVQPAIEKALATTTLSVNALISDHMVLQRNESVNIWGNASSGENVNVLTSWGQSAKTTTDQSGNWLAQIQTPEAGGPYEIHVVGQREKIEITDVMIGEVWLASGQSNMEMSMKGYPPTDLIDNAEQEIASAHFPEIRMFKVARNYSLEKQADVKGDWKSCTPEHVGDYSATAFFFARRLYQELQIPIGIVNSSWGGTPAEVWVSGTKVDELGDFKEMMDLLRSPTNAKKTKAWYGQFERRSFPENNEAWHDIDFGDGGFSSQSFNDTQWQKITLPGRIDIIDEKPMDGVFWHRKTITIDEPQAYTFHMGIVDDIDLVFVNGQKIGSTIWDFSNDRAYPIPEGLLKAGENTIAIRAIDSGGPGYIKGDLTLKSSAGEEISLNGEWTQLFTAEFYLNQIYIYDQEKVDLSLRPNIIALSPYTSPSVLYNAMIHPLKPYHMKGVVWYQGESNIGRHEQYEHLFPALINDWRDQWQTQLPFYFVQIAPFDYASGEDPKKDLSQFLRDAQRKTLTVPQTGMVVTLDVGDPKNIHPGNKQVVGSRLAGLALQKDYGKKGIATGPLYRNHTVKKNKLTVNFDGAKSGLLAKSGTIKGFEIAGADLVFYPAKGKIKKDRVTLTSDSVPNPQHVRYAWQNVPDCNLFNKEGLPASSFQTK